MTNKKIHKPQDDRNEKPSFGAHPSTVDQMDKKQERLPHEERAQGGARRDAYAPQSPEKISSRSEKSEKPNVP